MPSFVHEGHRLSYREYAARRARGKDGHAGDSFARGAGAGDRPVILVHGLLLSQRMHQPLARDLAQRGNRVITLDLLGHGSSDRPHDMWRYSMTFFAEQVVGLMDHLEIDGAVVLGTSLGANTALEVASLAPERLRGMVIEMPVLDNALLGCALAFTPLMVALTFGAPVMRAVSRAASLVPRRALPFYADLALDTLRQAPEPGAAVLQGLFFGRTAPHRMERRTFQTPALVIGHRRDPVHPFSDAGMLAEELPNARLLEADSLIELRFSPDRLTNEIAAFLDECWLPRTAARTGARSSARSGPRRRSASSVSPAAGATG